MKTRNDKPFEGTLPPTETAGRIESPVREGVEEAWPMDTEEETENLNRLQEMELDLVTDQLEKFGALDPQTAVRGYASLIEDHPEHPSLSIWKKRLGEWKNKNT